MTVVKGRFGFFREQRGFTLAEVLIAVAILAAIAVVFISALDTNARAIGTLDQRVVATNMATAYFEAISESLYDTAPPYYDDVVTNITVPAQYEVNYSVGFSSDGHEWTDTYSNETLQKITVFVSHQGKPVLSMCTFKAKKL